MQDSIFTKIIKGEIPSHKVYEDDRTLAFMDIHPAVTGHVVVVSKTQVEFVWDLTSSDYRALTDTVQKVALRLREVVGTPYVGQLVVGFDVPHAHIQLLPFTRPDEMKRVFEPEPSEPDHTALAELADRLKF